VQKKQGIYAVIAAIAIQIINGITYIWSVFQTGVAYSIFGGDNAAAGLTFSILILALTISAGIGGKLALRYSTRRAVFIGGIIMSVGFLTASFATESVAWLLWLSYGVMVGVGMGFTYSTTIACAQKWYPHKKGLITGIIIAGFGFSGVIFTPIVELLISAFGGSGQGGELRTFMVLGAVSLIVCTVGSIFLKNPPEGYMATGAAASNSAAASTSAANNAVASDSSNDKTPLQMLKTPQFYLMSVTYLLACLAGQMIIAFARPITVDRGFEAVAALSVILLAVFNSTGRIIWGLILDKIGSSKTILILLLGTAVGSFFVMQVQGFWVFILIALIAFFFGGLLVSFPPLTANLFGAKNMSANYGIVLISFGVGAVLASQIAGFYRNRAEYAADVGLMFPAFVIAALCAVAGIVMMLILSKMTKRKA